MSSTHKVYIPAGNWIVASITAYCQANGVGNADITGIGSITNIWVMLDPAGTPIVRNFSSGSYEMTSLLGNVTLRQGMPRFNPSDLASGQYPQIDSSVQTYNAYLHAHVTFANPDMTISGGHLLDAWTSIEAEVVIRSMAGPNCVPGLTADRIPADCVSDVMVTVSPLGTFSNWAQPFWYPPPAKKP